MNRVFDIRGSLGCPSVMSAASSGSSTPSISSAWPNPSVSAVPINPFTGVQGPGEPGIPADVPPVELDIDVFRSIEAVNSSMR
jgi:hypothetical protein